VNIVKGLVGNLIGTAFFMDTGHAGLHALVRKHVFVFFFKPCREHDAPESIGNLQEKIPFLSVGDVAYGR